MFHVPNLPFSIWIVPSLLWILTVDRIVTQPPDKRVVYEPAPTTPHSYFTTGMLIQCILVGVFIAIFSVAITLYINARQKKKRQQQQREQQQQQQKQAANNENKEGSTSSGKSNSLDSKNKNKKNKKKEKKKKPTTDISVLNTRDTWYQSKSKSGKIIDEIDWTVIDAGKKQDDKGKGKQKQKKRKSKSKSKSKNAK